MITRLYSLYGVSFDGDYYILYLALQGGTEQDPDAVKPIVPPPNPPKIVISPPLVIGGEFGEMRKQAEMSVAQMTEEYHKKEVEHTYLKDNTLRLLLTPEEYKSLGERTCVGDVIQMCFEVKTLARM